MDHFTFVLEIERVSGWNYSTPNTIKNSKNQPLPPHAQHRTKVLKRVVKLSRAKLKCCVKWKCNSLSLSLLLSLRKMVEFELSRPWSWQKITILKSCCRKVKIFNLSAQMFVINLYQMIESSLPLKQKIFVPLKIKI